MSIACIAMLVVTGNASAVTNSVATYTDNFEDYISGSNIANAVNGEWHAAADSHMIATNSPLNDLPTAQHAVPGAHTMVAKLDTEGDSVTNLFNGVAAGETKVWLDMNIQMVPSDSEPTAFTNDTEVQCALYMGTNGQLVAYNREMAEGTYTIASSNIFTALEHTAMETGSWHRLTVTMDYKSANAAFGPGYHLEFFKITVDGVDITNAIAWDDPGTLATRGGKWFLCANADDAVERNLNMALFSGTGYLDDFVATNGAPTQTATMYYTNGVPSYWLSAYSLELDNSSSGAVYNADNDMYEAWAEWLLGTDPTVSNDFQLTIESNGGTNTLKWVADGTMDASAPDIMIKKSVDLLVGYGSTQTHDRSTMSVGTNEWQDTTGGDAVYRLGVMGN